MAPPWFIATKLEAWPGGNEDPLGSRDLEELLNLLDGRPVLLDELSAASGELRIYTAAQTRRLLRHPDFEYLVQSTARGSPQREQHPFRLLEALAGLG